MFDFSFVFSSSNPFIYASKSHSAYLHNVSYCKKQIKGKSFTCEFYEHTGVQNEDYCQNRDLHVFLIGKVYSNRYLENKTSQAPKRLQAHDILTLYGSLGHDLIRYLKGIFLLVVCDESKGRYYAYSSKSGLLRLYYAKDGERLVLSSSLSSILDNLSTFPDLDELALMQHGVFEYTLGNRTLYKGISTCDNYSYLEYDLSNLKQHTYYDSADLLSSSRKTGWKDTKQQLPDEFNKAMELLVSDCSRFNTALTGGYDSRSVLSYLLKNKVPGYRLYTWAATKKWGDVAVAEELASKLHLKYDSIELGKEMLESYAEYADKQIYWSDGSGSINRCNQMYAHSVLASYSRDLLTGYFGSELFRPLHRSNVMIKELFIDLLLSDKKHREKLLLKNYESKVFSGYKNCFAKRMKHDFIDSCLDYFSSLDVTEHKHLNHLRYLIKTGFWKFYGQEFHSERINNRMTTPYIDDDFLEFIVSSRITDIHKGAYQNRGYLAFKGQAVYHPIFQKNYPSLMSFHTDRGFAPMDYESIIGPMKVFIKHRYNAYRQRKEKIIGFSAKTWNQDTFKERHKLMDYQDNIFSSVKADDPDAGLWYSLKWYLISCGEY